MDTDLFCSIPLLTGVPLVTLQAISRASSIKQFEDGQIIMFENDQNAPIFFILDGDVRVYRTNIEGREQTLALLKIGEAFNLPAAFSSDHLSPASAASFGKSKVLMIEQEKFRSLVFEMPEFSRVILNDLSDKLIHLTNLVHEVSLLSVRSRLAKFILNEFEHQGPSAVHWTQEQLAARLGTRREVLSRSFRELIKDGLIKTERQRIIIIDQERLKKEAGF